MFIRRKCKITFIKHGATINTEENRFFDDGNFPPLNEAGREEIEKISKWVSDKGLKIDKIYSSPSLRCVQSAGILSEVVEQDFEILNNLTGRKIGSWSGLNFDEINKLYPKELEQYFNNPENFCPKDAQPLAEFNLSVMKNINEIIKQNMHKRIIIVTHGEVIQSAIANALNIPLNSQLRVYVPTGSATQISYFEDIASLIYSAYQPL